MSQIIPSKTIEEIFSDVVDEALHIGEINASPQLRLYLVQLLDKAIRNDDLLQRILQEQPDGTTKYISDVEELSHDGLTLLHNRAKEEPNKYLRGSIYLQAGDYALMVSGVFPEKLYASRVHSLEYFQDIGSSSYAHASTELENSMLAELAAKFGHISTSMQAVPLTQVPEEQVLLLLNRSQRGNPLARKALVRKGITLH